jgi:hypothetical protein
LWSFAICQLQKKEDQFSSACSVVAADPGGHREEAEIAWYGR